ncbi:MAG: hypothetical protein ACOYMN_02780 [Roseimicrobium sp.]
MNRALPFLAAIASLVFVAATPARAQVVVYKVDFSESRGVNFHTFDGGYIVAPLLGGTTSFLLTSSFQKRTYVNSAEGGKIFTAVNGRGEQKAVLSATTGSGTATGALVAFGDINYVLRVSSKTLTLAAKVAKTLTGTLVSSDDESTVDSTALDGSLGSAGFAQVKLVLDESQSNSANKDGLSMAQTIDVLKLELERQGYSAETGTTDTGTDTTTSVTVTP